jgi:formiminotetrahydrofolate cyclodeaminase
MNTASMTTTEFLSALAAGQSTPGGGGAAALTAAQAAALVSMVINFTIGKKKDTDVEVDM